MLGSFTVVCPAASVTISAGGATTFCSGGSVVLSKSSVPTFTTYQWELDGAIISGETNTSYTATASGSYTLTVTNSCGNTATSAGIAVTVNTAPTAGQATITAGGPTSFCGSTGVLLSVATSGLTYQWLKNGANISGQTNQSYTAKATATFSCNVSNSCGTTLSNSIATVKNTAPTSTVSQAPCSGGAVLLTCTPTPTTGITFQWKKGSNVQSGATNSTFSATSNGTYKCTVTITATGCTKTSAGSSVTITCKTQNQIANDQVIVYPNPSADYFVINTSSLDKNDAVMIYDLTGKLLEHYSINGEEIKVGATLTNGIYFARIENNGAIQQVIKLVKNR